MWNTMHIGSIEYIVGPQDWCITSDWTEPPAQCKKATIINDLTVFQHPETVDTTILRTQKKRLQWVVKESDLIIAVSDATAMDIAQFLPHIRGVVQTIPSGASITLPPDKACDAVQKKYNLTQPFILSVGKLEPRKNIARLIEAFTKLQKENLELVIVGQKGWGTEIKPVPHVHFVGLITDIELSALYERCLFFAYPSLWEGFGYPVVEAMLHKKAVLTSTTPSLQKLGEQGGTTCNPESVEDIARNLLLLATDTGLRTQKAEQGYLFVQRFSWKTYYETLIQTLYAHRS
jgi:glycosyltransferase involved in cell wall biosynthesis